MPSATTQELTSTPRRILDATFAAIQDYGLTRITGPGRWLRPGQRPRLSRMYAARVNPFREFC